MPDDLDQPPRDIATRSTDEQGPGQVPLQQLAASTEQLARSTRRLARSTATLAAVGVVSLGLGFLVAWRGEAAANHDRDRATCYQHLQAITQIAQYVNPNGSSNDNDDTRAYARSLREFLDECQTK